MILSMGSPLGSNDEDAAVAGLGDLQVGLLAQIADWDQSNSVVDCTTEEVPRVRHVGTACTQIMSRTVPMLIP
jgi:hypothetical protein